jgi:hypothetical protein
VSQAFLEARPAIEMPHLRIKSVPPRSLCSLFYRSSLELAIQHQISSAYNRAESVPTFDFGSLTYSYDFLRQQYGQYNSTLPQRGVLQMHNQSWIATPTQLARNELEPLLRLLSHIGTGADMSAMMGGY